MMKKFRYIVPLVLVAALLLPLTAFAQGPEQGTTPRYCATPVTHGVAEAIGLDARDLVQQVRGGATLAAIITGAGYNVDELVAAEVADFRARLDEAVANGLMTAEAADARAAQHGQNITAQLNGERPAAPDVPQPAQPNQPGQPGQQPAQPNQPGQPGQQPAQPNQPGQPGQQPAQPNQPGQPGQPPAAQPNQPAQPGQPPAAQPGQPNAAPQGDNARRLVQAVAEATGLDPAAIVEMVQGGMTLAAVASANGADPAAIVEGLIAEARTQAEQRLAALETALTAAMNGETPPQPVDIEALREGAERIVVNAVLEATGTQLEPRVLVQALCDGATIAVLISEAGGDPRAVMADINAQVSAALDTLETQGRLDGEQAANLTEGISTFIENLFTGRVALPIGQNTVGAGPNNVPGQVNPGGPAQVSPPAN